MKKIIENLVPFFLDEKNFQRMGSEGYSRITPAESFVYAVKGPLFLYTLCCTAFEYSLSGAERFQISRDNPLFRTINARNRRIVCNDYAREYLLAKQEGRTLLFVPHQSCECFEEYFDRHGSFESLVTGRNFKEFLQQLCLIHDYKR